MLKHYLRIAFRYMSRTKGYTFINIFGLGLGIASCLLIFLFLRYEWGYNSYYADSERIYRVVGHTIRSDRDPYYNTKVSALFLPAVEDQIPGMDSITRLSVNNRTLRAGEETYRETGVALDPAGLDVFGYKFVEGDKYTALSEPGKVILSQKLASKMFGDSSAVGKMVDLYINNEFTPLIVSAVAEDIPENNSATFDFIYHFEKRYDEILKGYTENWGFSWCMTYMKLTPGVKPGDVENAIKIKMDELEVTNRQEDRTYLVHLQPINTEHIALHNPRGYVTETEPTASFVLLAIGLVIISIAIINFTTLSIGLSINRTTEVGVRKVLGAQRGHLISQFWNETGILALFAVVCGAILAYLFLPVFNSFAELEISFTPVSEYLLALFVLWILLIFAAGSYPALVVSRLHPMGAIKKTEKVVNRGWLRKTLVLIQFTLSAGLLTATLLMHNQMMYINKFNVGFAEDQVLAIKVKNQDDTGLKLMNIMREELRSNPDVISVSGSDCVVGDWLNTYKWGLDGQEYGPIFVHKVDADFLKTMQLKLVAGRDFDRNIANDLEYGQIVNQAFLEYFGWDTHIGKVMPGGYPQTEIVGVIEDYNFTSLRQKIPPQIICLEDNILDQADYNSTNYSEFPTIQYILIRMSGQNIKSTIRQIESIWKDIAPERILTYEFVDEKINKLYEDERRWNSIVSAASILALVISILGLLGIATLDTRQRTREIGIRKVLGASEQSIVLLLSREITILILLANVIALPLATIFIKRWLDTFAYQAPMGILSFILAGGSMLILVWLVVGALAWKASLLNPVKTLRYE